jgi:hypothetical protein
MKEVAKVFGGGGNKESGAMASINAQQDAILAKREQEASAEQVKLQSQQMATLRARQRGGNRMLLSSQRLNPETGLATTLGAAL